MDTSSLKLLVVNTNKIQLEMLELIMMANDYDVIVLMPALKMRSNAKYIIGETSHYTLCIHRNQNIYSSIVPILGDTVYGIHIPRFNLLVLSVDTDVEDGFAPKVKELYPHQMILVVHRSIPSMVFDIHTGDRQTILHNNHTSFYVVCVPESPIAA